LFYRYLGSYDLAEKDLIIAAKMDKTGDISKLAKFFLSDLQERTTENEQAK
jgi:hypothetical protein